MPKKLKFKPRVTRIKLNPEQAVLACSCFSTRRYILRATYYADYSSQGNSYCFSAGKPYTTAGYSVCSATFAGVLAYTSQDGNAQS